MEGSFKNLMKLSSGDTDKAISIIQQSIDNEWQGLWELKNSVHKRGGNALDDLINDLKDA